MDLRLMTFKLNAYLWHLNKLYFKSVKLAKDYAYIIYQKGRRLIRGIQPLVKYPMDVAVRP